MTHRRPSKCVVSAVVVWGGVCAACAPQPDAAEAAPVRVAAHDIALASDTLVVSARIAAGATLASMLHAQHVAAQDAAELVAQTATVFDLRRVRANQPYRLETRASGALRQFDYEIDGDRFLRVTRDSDALEAAVLPIPKTRRLERITGQIDRSASSLVAAMDAAGETIDLTLAMADILGGEIDFSTELQPGDRFELSVEKQYRDDQQGAFAGYGPIAAVEFVNAGRRVRAIRFTPDGGQPGYYDERGTSMKRFFLASPLKFNPVVTSAFSRQRMHPILREVRAHLGVDYRAPAGSPVIAVSDGVVLRAGMAGGAGRMVHLHHSNGYESQYLHLSSIAVRAGMHVKQGELIGRVGSSGLATGAHLDYRLKKNGAYINPVTAHGAMPPADPVPAAQMTGYSEARTRALATLGLTPNREPAVARAVNSNSTTKR